MPCPKRLFAVVPVVAVVGLLACAGPPLRPESPLGTGRFELHGRVTYERRLVSPRGLTASTVRRAARRVLVTAADAEGVTRAVGYTDDEGRWSLRFASARTLSVQVASVSHVDGFDLRVLRSTSFREPHAVSRSRLVPARDGDGPSIDLHAGIGANEPAGAFHILDVLLTGARAVRAALGTTLPPVIAFWRRGNTREEAATSSYGGMSAVDRGSFELVLMGGDPERPDQSDSDHFDTSVVLHELGHLVLNWIAGRSSAGGDHSVHSAVVPSIAFDEGFADFFAGGVLRNPIYSDSVGVEPQGRLSVRHDLEDLGDRAVRGVGGEASTTEILWDMADGREILDRDGDGVALGFDETLLLVSGLGPASGDYPYLGSILRLAVQTGVLTDAQVQGLLSSPRNHGISWPLTDDDVWPEDIDLPARARGALDGARGRSAFDAARVYRFVVPRRSRLRAVLTIDGSGRVADHQDLDLFLCDLWTRRLARSFTERRVEEISEMLDEGTYVLWVRVGGDKDRAAYRLDAWLE